MKQRRKNAFFQDLLEAGSRTTYHGKIRGRSSGRPRATVSRGKQRTYKGVQIIPLGGGEYTISIDRDSRFENVRDAKKVIDHMKGNPSKTRYLIGSNEYPTKARAIAKARQYANEEGEPVKVTVEKERFSKYSETKSRVLGGSRATGFSYSEFYVHPGRGNPRGSKGKFQRCVESVAARGGAYDPRAVCGEMEKRLQKNAPLDPEERKRIRAEVRKQDAARKRLRRKQDQLIRLAESRGYADHLQISPDYAGAPTVGQLRGYVFPEWEGAIDSAISRLKRERGRRNPAAGAIAVSEEFHGRKVKQMVPVQSQRHYHKYLADLGELRKLVVLTRDGKGKVTLTGFKGAMLTCNEAKDQLFITGGDQTVNPKDFGIDHPHEVETLGEVVTIEYFTDKHHLGSEGGTATYTHKFRSTNENGKHVTVRTARNPDLIYHKRDKHLEFSGGSYLIRKEGIDL